MEAFETNDTPAISHAHAPPRIPAVHTGVKCDELVWLKCPQAVAVCVADVGG